MNKSEIKLIRKDNNLNRKSNIEYQIDYLDKNDYLREQKLKPRIDTLQEGQIFDNWLHLFDYLDLYYPIGNGNSVVYQNRLKCWVNIEKGTGTKLIIKEIYIEPIEWIDNRKKGNHSIYITFVSTLLLWKLLKETEHKIEVTYNQLWKMLGMKNNYYGNKEIQKFLPKVDEDMTPDFLNDFYKWTGSKIKNITDYALDTLQDKGYLKYTKQIMMKENNIIRKVTSIEESKILSEETKIMKAMGYNSRKDLFMANKSLELYNRVKKELGFSYFDILSIIVPDDEVLSLGILENIEELKNFDNIQEREYKKKLNQEITEYDLKGAKKRKDNEFERLDQLYKEYEKNIALGVPESKEDFIITNGYSLFIDSGYIDKFKKAAEYFNDLKLTPRARETIKEVELLIEEERKKEFEKIKEGEI